MDTSYPSIGLFCCFLPDDYRFEILWITVLPSSFTNIHALTNLVDGIMRLKGHKKILEINNDTFIYYGRLCGRVPLDSTLSVDLVMKSWSTPMDDAKSSTIYYILKRIDDFREYKVLGKEEV